jgi:RND family efflux transporter MFP subunit
VLVLGSSTRGSVFRVDVVDRDVVRLRLGARATVRLDAAPGRQFQGTVVEIAAAPTPGTGTYAVKVSVPDAARLPSGLVGRAEIAADGAGAVTIVPVEAVVEADGDRAVVFVLQQRRAHRRDVQVAFIDGRMVGVRGNLAGAEAVITDGAAYLDDGDAVRVTP